MTKILIIIAGFLCAIGTEVLAYIVLYPIMFINEIWLVLFLTSIINYICVSNIEYLYFSHNKTKNERYFNLLFITGLGLGIVVAMKYTQYTATGPDIGFYVLGTALLPIAVWLGIFLCRLIIDVFNFLLYRKRQIEITSTKHVYKNLFIVFWILMWSILMENTVL